ncbi:MAG: hypothetical protein D6690_05895 [Nitrospirae bacterium]|nr:MAG: hypothetical protein D6690_05895 [Nitrospirota bacterium]
MGKEKRKVDLTVYLAKEECAEPSNVVKADKVEREISLSGGQLYIAGSHSYPPRWAAFFEGSVDSDDFGRNQSTGALLVVQASNRLLLFCFGQGRHLARTECIQPNFGLRVAINLLDPKSIRSLDKSLLESQPKQAREQSGEAVGLDFFGIDIESDLLRAITGRPKSDEFGKRLSGGDPVKLSINISLNEVTDLATKLLQAYSSEAYKNGPFAWIDHIGQVKDKSLREELDSKLIESLNQKNFDRVWLCAPKIVEWERVAGFKYSSGNNAIQYPDTRINECLQEIATNKISLELLKRRKIQAVDEEDAPIFEDTVYRFIYAEIELEGKAYILNAGTWYSVNSDYVQRIQQYYENIMREKQYEHNLPEYNDESEEKYNRRVVESDTQNFALMDRNLISLPDAASPVEPCDIYRREKELIHVKKYGGSAVLSHLFHQGLVSGELLKRELEFRKALNQGLPEHLKINGIENQPGHNEYTIVYTIISEQEQGLNLPFFSKISIKHAVNRLEAFGHKVRIAKIPVAEMKKQTKKYPSA